MSEGAPQFSENNQNKANNWQVKAAVLELLSFSYLYPTQKTVLPLVSGEYKEAICEIAFLTGITLPEEETENLSLYIGCSDDELLRALRKEATRMFLGIPEPLISPYEGIWRAEDDGTEPLLFINPHSMAVERFMNSCGLMQAEGKNEPFDYVATELEFLEYLAGLEAGIVAPSPQIECPEKGWAYMYEQFFEEHIQTWMPRFAKAVISETRESYYKVSALLLREFLMQ